jgi:flagellar basal body rod protein FlgG
MLSGFYTAASGILVQQRNINVIGNNIVNSSTPGYRSERLVTSTFDHEYLVRRENYGNDYTYLGSGSPVNIVDDIPVDYTESSLEETDSPFDNAIVGEGYFNIQGEERIYMTRNGNFDVDEEGYLILPDTGRVIGNNGFIQVGGSDFTVKEDGTVLDAQGNEISKLEITMPADGAELVKYENALFVCDNTRQAEGYSVYQKALERSNVDMNSEYTRLIEAQNAFKASSTAIGIIDSMNAKAAQLASIT